MAYQIRTSDEEIGPIIQRLAKEDKRSIGEEVAWIIRQEEKRRESIRQSLLTESVEEDIERRR